MTNGYKKYGVLWKRRFSNLLQQVNKGKYINPKLKMYKGEKAVKYHGNDEPYDKHCEARGVLRQASVYNQGINY